MTIQCSVNREEGKLSLSLQNNTDFNKMVRFLRLCREASKQDEDPFELKFNFQVEPKMRRVVIQNSKPNNGGIEQFLTFSEKNKLFEETKQSSSFNRKR